MADVNNHKSKSNKAFRDFTQTPKWCFNAWNSLYNYNLDGAALPVSALCQRFITPKQNSLKKCWATLLKDEIKPAVWVNPPYSDILPWVQKALKERQKGVLSTLFVPHENRAQWWPVETASKIIDITGYYETYIYKSGKRKGQTKQKWCSGGISFVNAKTGLTEKCELNKPMCLIVFDPLHVGPCEQTYIRKNELMKLGNKH